MRRDRSGGLYMLPNGIEVPSLIKSIQRGTITLTTPATSATATITAVATSRSRLRLLYQQSEGGSSTALIRIDLTDATTVTIRNAGTATETIASFEVTEFHPGIIKSIQRGSITLTAPAVTNTATITAVNTAKAELSWLGLESSGTSGAQTDTHIQLTNATTITATRESGAGDVTVNYEVVEWF